MIWELIYSYGTASCEPIDAFIIGGAVTFEDPGPAGAWARWACRSAQKACISGSSITAPRTPLAVTLLFVALLKVQASFARILAAARILSQCQHML